MENADSRKLCIGLAKAESEKEVIDLLKKAGYWGDPDAWQFYGGVENNFSTIGNQQSSPDAALVEKIVNSVDAVLLKECLKRGIDPEGRDAPENLKQAVKEYFDVTDGILSHINPRRRTELAQNILLVATGKKSSPCYSIIDKGEGQTPKTMPDTFLSLAKSNKLKIPFVQGKFNMGGTGSLQFCGKNNIQLIVSKRAPEIVDRSDPTSGYWGFTVVRREDPSGGLRSSTFKYLAPGGEILMFEADNLPLLPGKYPSALERPLEYGSFVKLYEYQLKGYLSPVVFDLHNRIASLLPSVGLPVQMVERRVGYSGHTLNTTLSGLSVRLDEDKFENIEGGFPSSDLITINGQGAKIQIYVFKKDEKGSKKEKYARKEGVIFTLNGQAHGFIPKTFFARKSVGMSYLDDSILILADCSNFDGRTREDLFMNSRDRLREGDLKKEIEEKLAYLIKNHEGLRALKEKRRREEIEGKIGDSKPLVDVIEKVIRKSPALTKLLISGARITNPFDLVGAGERKEKYEGKEFPSYFKLKQEFPKNNPKHCPKNQRCRIQFETDVENNYFSREMNPGENSLTLGDGTPHQDYILNLWNGVGNLTLDLPECSEGDVLKFIFEVSDISQTNSFKSEFYIAIENPVKKRDGKPGKRADPPLEDEGNRKKPSYLAVPNVLEVHEDEWGRHGMDKESSLIAKGSDEDGYEFYINMDNVYFLTEIKGRGKTDPDLLKAQYKYGMTLIGMAILKDYDEKSEEETGVSIFDSIQSISKSIAPMLIPMIQSLGELEIEE